MRWIRLIVEKVNKLFIGNKNKDYKNFLNFSERALKNKNNNIELLENAFGLIFTWETLIGLLKLFLRLNYFQMNMTKNFYILQLLNLLEEMS